MFDSGWVGYKQADVPESCVQWSFMWDIITYMSTRSWLSGGSQVSLTLNVPQLLRYSRSLVVQISLDL